MLHNLIERVISIASSGPHSTTIAYGGKRYVCTIATDQNNTPILKISMIAENRTGPDRLYIDLSDPNSIDTIEQALEQSRKGDMSNWTSWTSRYIPTDKNLTPTEQKQSSNAPQTADA